MRCCRPFLAGLVMWLALWPLSARGASHSLVAPADTAVSSVAAAAEAIPVLNGIELKDGTGTSTAVLSPQDTFFVDVSLEDDDGFHDVSELGFSFFYDGHEGEMAAPAYSALCRWQRGALPSWTVEYPAPTTWQVLPNLCIADTVADSPGPVTVRLAFLPGAVARADLTGKWSVRVTARSDTPVGTATSLLGSLKMAPLFALNVADTSGTFSPGNAGDTDLPLDGDGMLDLAMTANAPFHLKMSGVQLTGVLDTTDVIPVDPNIAWTLVPGDSGILQEIYTTVMGSVPPLETEAPLARDLRLTLDLPADLSAQEYLGAVDFRMVPLTAGPSWNYGLPLRATILSEPFAAESALAEVLPDTIVAGTSAQAFVAFLSPQLGATGTGVDRIRIELPAGYANPVITSVTVDGGARTFVDQSGGDSAVAEMSTPVATDALISVAFTADAPSIPDPAGKDFPVFFDDAQTAAPAQAATEGDGDATPGTDDWRVVVIAGPPAALDVVPDAATLFVDSTAVFTASVTDAHGNPLSSAVTWSAEGSVGMVDGAGVFTATAAGSGLIIGDVEGLRDTSGVTVLPNRGLVLLSVDGPAQASQGETGLAMTVRLANLGSQTVAVDTLRLDFTRTPTGDADEDFAVTPDAGNPGTLAAGSEAVFHFTADADRDAVPGEIRVDARAAGTESGSGYALTDDGADTTLTLTLTPGGITVRAEQASATVAPGASNTLLMSLALANADPDPVRLQALTVTNSTSGPGTQTERDAELGTATLYRDDGDGVFEPAADPPLASAAAGGGVLSFSAFSATVAGQDSLRLFVAVDLPLAVRDGDTLDLYVSDESRLTFNPTVFTRNDWPLDPPGSSGLDGLVAAQIGVTSVPGSQAVAGETDLLGLNVLVPRNGYEDDILNGVRVTNQGTALPSVDLQTVKLWRDGGNQTFDAGAGDDALLGAPAWDGSGWTLTGLNEPVPAAGIRLFASFDVSALATAGRTVRLALPGGSGAGLTLASANDGPRDAPVPNPGSQVVVSDPNAVIRATVGAQTPAALRPGGASVEVFRLTVENATATAETLVGLTLENMTAGPGTMAQLDHDWSTLSLSAVSLLPGGPTLGTTPTTTVVSDRAAFTGFSLVLDPGDVVDLVVTGGASLLAREGDLLDFKMVGPEGLTFTRTVPFDAAWPLHPAGTFTVDGMTAAQVSLHAVATGALQTGVANQLVLDVTVPANGYVADLLQQVLVGNLGDAAAGADLTALRLWRDGGDAAFDGGSGDDAPLGPAIWNGSHWVLAGLSQTVPVSGLRLFASADVSLTATLGRTVRLWLPPTPDDAFRMASGNSGPIDSGVSNSGSLVIVADPDAALQAAVSAQASSALLPGGSAVEALTLTLANATAFAETLSAVTLSNRTSGPGSTTDLDGEWTTLSLAVDAAAGVTRLGGALPASGFSSGTAIFDGLSLIIQPGATATLRFTGGATLAARDGDVLDLGVAGVGAFTFNRAVNVDGAWPLEPPGGFPVDGMAAAQIGTAPVSDTAPLVGAGDVLALDFLVPANGYATDVLQQVRLGNAGTAAAGDDITRIAIWRDGGNGIFDAGSGDDVPLGPAPWNGSHWVLSGLSESVPVAGLRLFAAVDLAPGATVGRTVRLTLPTLPDLGLTMSGSNDGPRDAEVQAPTPLTLVSDPDAVVRITAAQTATSLLPGGDPVEMLRIVVENRTAEAETLVTLSLVNDVAGPGSSDDLTAAWSGLELRLGGPGGKPGPIRQTPSGGATHGGAVATFSELGIPLPAGETVTLTVLGGASLTARDGDAFDLRVEGPDDVVFTREPPLDGQWPLDPSGAFVVDGMAAAQLQLGAVADGVVDVGESRRLAFNVLLPANGYEADVLRGLRLENLGTAEIPGDLARVSFWADGGDDYFDGGSGDDVDLGDAAWDGTRWVLTGLDLAIPLEGVRVYASVDIATHAEPGRTVRFSLPASPADGVSVQSGNDGPRDRPLANPGTLTITENLAGSVEVATDPQTGGTLLPGGPLEEVLRLRFHNTTAWPETLTALTVRNAAQGPGTRAQLDAEWSEIVLLAVGNGSVSIDPTDDALATATISAGNAIFNGLQVVLGPGEETALALYAGASLAARDDDILDLALTGPEAFTVRPAVSVAGTWPLNPAGSFRVDGMAAAQITVAAVPSANFESGSTRNLALDLVLPPNGYSPDVLQRIDVVNLGTAKAATDIDAVMLWSDDGDGGFDSLKDTRLGALTFTGSRWEITGLSEAVGAGGARIYLTVDIADLATEGRTVRLAVPSLPDLGVGMASGNDGPLDRPVANGDEQIITVADRLILAASPVASGVVHPGDDDVALLCIAVTNTYDSPRTLTGLVFANASSGSGDQADRDGAFDVLLLAADRDGDGIYGPDDEVLGSAVFSAGAAAFRGLEASLDPGASAHLFLLGDVSLRGAADGDVLTARVTGPLDLEFAEPTAVAADWPLDSGARWVVDGMVADQITRFDTAVATVGPGTGPLPALDMLLPPDGYRDDVLNGLRVTNLGSAGAGDLAECRLWRDGGDGVFSAGGGDDRDLGVLSWIGDSWQSLFLEEAVTGAGARYFVALTVAEEPSDSSTVRLAVPVNGITMASGNDGPLDRPVENEQTILLSSAPLLATLKLSPAASTVGQAVLATMTVENIGAETVENISPSSLVASGAGSLAPVGGPEPALLTLAPGETGAFVWTYASASAGPVELSGLAAGDAGGGGDRRSLTTTSNRHRVFVEADELELFALESMPFSVSLGQTGVAPLSLTFRNPGSETGSDVFLTSLRIRLEDEGGNGIVPADLLTRVVVNEGNRVYLDRPAAQLETTGAEAELTLATPVRVTSVEPTTLNLQVDIAAEALVPNFRLVIIEGAWIEAKDATSGAPVAVALQERAYPIRSGLARLVAEATRVAVTGSPSGEHRVGPGSRDVDLMAITLENPGIDDISADVRVGAFAVRITDATGQPVAHPAELLSVLRAKTALATLGVREVASLGDGVMAIELSPPLTLPVNTPVSLIVTADVAATAPVGAFRLQLAGAEDFVSRDAITRNLVPAVYDPDPVWGYDVRIEEPAEIVLASGVSLFPSHLLVGARGVDALAAVFQHPGSAGTARIRLDSITVSCRSEARAALVPSLYLDRVAVLWDGVEVAARGDLPSTGGSVVVPLPGMVLEPGESGELRVSVNVEASAPGAFLELTVTGAGIAAVDLNSERPVAVAPGPGAELPLYSGLTRLESPARDVVAGLDDRMPAALVADGRGVEAGLLRLRNPAPAGTGIIQLDHLSVMASTRDGQSLAAGAAVERLSIWRDGEKLAESAVIEVDSLTAFIGFPEPLSIRAGEEIALTVMMKVREQAGVDGFRLGFAQEGIGVVQPAGALFEVAVRARDGEVFPLWTKAGNFSPAGLRDSYANFPNPFAAGREETAFAFHLAQDAHVTLRVWTARGEEVITLLDDEPRPAGLQQSDRWNGQNGRGSTVVNGVYIAELVVRFADGTSERLLRKVAVAR